MRLDIDVRSAAALRAFAGLFEELAKVRAAEVADARKFADEYAKQRDARDAAAGEPVHLVADPEEKPTEAPKRRGRPPKPAAPETVSTNPNAPQPLAPASGATPETPSAAPAAELTVKDAKDALSALVERSSLTVGMEALSRFGATRISELKPEQWAEFIDFCGTLNATAPVAA